MVEAEYWRLVERIEGGCWKWSGAKIKGYGRLFVAGKHKYAHRLSWEIHFGPIPNGMMVCHRCDNPECSNPDHLFLGTAADNMQDKMKKGRWKGGNKKGAVTGLKNGRAVLDWEKVALIRSSRGIETQQTLAQRFGVSPSTVSQIWNERIWKGQESEKAIPQS